MKDSFKELTYPELLAKREELRKQYGEICANKIIGHVDNPVSKRTARVRDRRHGARGGIPSAQQGKALAARGDRREGEVGEERP